MEKLKKVEKEWPKNKSEIIITRKFHIENLYELLQKSFYERNFCRASEILEVLLKCPECDMTRIWQPAVGVLVILDPTSTAFIEFFNLLLFKKDVKTKRNAETNEDAKIKGSEKSLDKQKVIMELVFYQIKYGQTIDALATIETYLPQEPYCNNPLLYGYAGLLTYSLWEQLNATFKAESKEPKIVGYKPPKRKNASKKIIPPREGSKRRRNADEKKEDFIEVDEQMMDQCEQYYARCLRNFKTSIDMDKSNDMFLVYYVKLLLYKEEIGEAIDAIQDFCDENPSILTGHSLLFEVLYTYERRQYKWVEVGKTFHRIDPVSPPDKVFNPLMEYYTQVIEQTSEEDRNILADAYFNMCELLFQRIEYGDDNTDYLYQAIECFVWLEYFDDTGKVKINELLKNRGKWFRQFLFYTQKKTINSWREFQCYRILNECLNGDKCCHLVKKIKEYILAGKNFHTVLYNFEKKKYYGNVDGNVDWNWNID